jgi:hypothetical protein
MGAALINSMAVRLRSEDAEWMLGKTRGLPAIDLTEKGFLMDAESGHPIR